MRNRALLGILLAAFSALGVPTPAHAQFAVIDVASLGQLIQQVSTLEQQVATARSQLSQAQSEYAAITGSRGMHLLLTGVNRNYLPANWGELSQVMSGASARFRHKESVLDNGLQTPSLRQQRLGSASGADLFRPGVGRDVVVLGDEAQQLVPNAAAGPQGFVTGVPQSPDHLDGEVPLGHGHPKVQ